MRYEEFPDDGCAPGAVPAACFLVGTIMAATLIVAAALVLA